MPFDPTAPRNDLPFRLFCRRPRSTILSASARILASPQAEWSPATSTNPHLRRADLLSRPDRVAERSEFGHWECDLMLFRKEHGKINVTSLVERESRFAVLMRNEDRRSKPIMQAMI